MRKEVVNTRLNKDADGEQTQLFTQPKLHNLRKMGSVFQRWANSLQSQGEEDAKTWDELEKFG